MKRRFIKYACLAVALAAGAAPGLLFAQQAYPNKPIRIIVPYAAGGSADTLARSVAQRLSENLGQSVVVENRAGGAAVIGSEAVKRSAPDGYTIMVTSGDHVVIPQLIATPFHPVKDFVPVGGIAYAQVLLVAHPSVPVSNAQEFLAFVKAKPNQFNYSSSGTGGVPNLTGELMAKLTGIKMQHVPYKGGGPAMLDLIAGHVTFNLGPPINAIPNITAGKAKPIAITGQRRLAVLPQVPTFEESGIPGLDTKIWFGMFAPVGTPVLIVDRLSKELVKVLAKQDVKDAFAAQGMEPYPLTDDEFASVVKSDYAKYGEIIRAADIKLEK
jgi:tripartite-type tricarboxylate transporter receptor subunit TctC